MRDYLSVAKALRFCAYDDDSCKICNCELEECNSKVIMEIAADAIEELQNQVVDLNKMVPEWISVEKQLPKDGTCVLGWDGQRVRFVYVVDDFIFMAFAKKWHITHWMPLPEPPKEGRAYE